MDAFFTSGPGLIIFPAIAAVIATARVRIGPAIEKQPQIPETVYDIATAADEHKPLAQFRPAGTGYAGGLAAETAVAVNIKLNLQDRIVLDHKLVIPLSRRLKVAVPDAEPPAVTAVVKSDRIRRPALVPDSDQMVRIIYGAVKILPVGQSAVRHIKNALVVNRRHRYARARPAVRLTVGAVFVGIAVAVIIAVCRRRRRRPRPPARPAARLAAANRRAPVTCLPCIRIGSGARFASAAFIVAGTGGIPSFAVRILIQIGITAISCLPAKICNLAAITSLKITSILLATIIVQDHR